MTSATLFGVPYKYVSLFTLVIQNSTLVIVMHYSRIRADKDHQYYTSTAVFLAELIKLFISLYFAVKTQIAEAGRWSVSELYHDVFSHDAWKLTIPAALYTVQNNLQYVAVSLLNPPTFAVTYQLKILSTALFSVIMLKKSLNNAKWFSLVLLTVGVALVQLDAEKKKEIVESEGDVGLERFVGLGAVAVACVISGIAGVYFEKVLKGTQASVWTRNVQLSFFSLFTALIMGVWWKDGPGVAENGFFFGYNLVVWSAILCQAVGGIIVALVVKYADNILKGFATSISIILSFMASLVLFSDSTSLSMTFLVGAALVLAATYMYSKPDAAPILPKETVQKQEAQTLNSFRKEEEQYEMNDNEFIYRRSNDGYTKVNQVDEQT